MLVALGFLSAALLGLLLAPFYRRRTSRLAVQQLKQSLPLSEAEIRADKDRLRAEFAILIHQLEARVEKASLAAARQRIELNRRDAAISTLEGEVARLRTSLEEHENARRVLEQTITDRLPKVEQRLAEAKRMLAQRDREIAALSETAASHARALDEATQINTQQRDELYRLNAALTTRAARNREGLGDPRFDGEVALRSEIEALRAKSREQASLIARLQGLIVRQGSAGEPPAEGRPSVVAGSGLSSAGARADEEIKRLRSDLAEAEEALRDVKSTAEAGKAGQEALNRELRTLKAANQDQAAEIARLAAALGAYEAAEKDDKTLKESKLSMKARLSALQAQTEEQAATIQSLRAEGAAANERLAPQAAHFRDEIRRFGAAPRPRGAWSIDRQARGSAAPARRSTILRGPAPGSGRWTGDLGTARGAHRRAASGAGAQAGRRGASQGRGRGGQAGQRLLEGARRRRGGSRGQWRHRGGPGQSGSRKRRQGARAPAGRDRAAPAPPRRPHRSHHRPRQDLGVVALNSVPRVAWLAASPRRQRLNDTPRPRAPCRGTSSRRRRCSRE